MNLLTVVDALNEARADADAGLLELVLELRGDMLVFGYWCGKVSHTKAISIKGIWQSRFLHDVVYGECSEMIKEIISNNLDVNCKHVSNEKEGQTVFSYKAPAIIITERYEDTEKVLEFATSEDYAAYKRIESDWLTSAEIRCRRL